MKITLDDMIIAFDKKPEDAIKYFQELGVEPSEGWQETMQAIEDDAFAISGVKNMDSLMDAKDIIQDALDKGTDLKEFKTKIKETLELANWHADLVVTQNISNAYHAGTLTRQLETIEELPYVRFILGGRQEHTPGCLYLVNNRIAIRLDDPNIRYFYPPRHFHCGTTTATVTKRWLDRNGYKIMKGGDIPTQYRNAKGFEHMPNVPFRDRIDLSEYPKELLKQFEKKK